MDDAAAVRKPCGVCDGPGGWHCTKCKSRHYCSKACQLIDWYERGHKAQCKRLAAEFQDRLLDAPEKVKTKEEPAIVADVAPAAGSKALGRAPAVRAAATAKAGCVSGNEPDWRGTCVICLDLLPVEKAAQRFYSCCCKKICNECSNKYDEYDTRCPLCRAPRAVSDAEWVRRLQEHVDEGNAEAHFVLGHEYSDGGLGLKKSPKRAFQLYEPAAAQGHASAQHALGSCYHNGNGVKIDHKTAAQWYRRAAERGYPDAQCNLGNLFHDGKGVAQSDAEAVRWLRLAAAQGHARALYNLGLCHANGLGLPRDHEALRCFKRAAAKEYTDAGAAEIAGLQAKIGRAAANWATLKELAHFDFLFFKLAVLVGALFCTVL